MFSGFFIIFVDIFRQLLWWIVSALFFLLDTTVMPIAYTGVYGVPLTAVIYDIIRQLTRAGLRRFGQEKLFDQYNEEFHPPEQEPAKKRRGHHTQA